MTREIRFTTGYEDPQVIEVYVTATNGVFAGRTGVHLQTGELANAAERMRGFPKDPSDVRELTLRSLGSQTAGGPAVSMRLFCVDAAGHACVECRLDGDTQDRGVPESVTLRLAVDAAAIDSFVAQLRRLRVEGSAVLKGAV